MRRRTSTRRRPLVAAAIAIIGFQFCSFISSKQYGHQELTAKEGSNVAMSTTQVDAIVAPLPENELLSSLENEIFQPRVANSITLSPKSGKDRPVAEVREILLAMGETPFFNNATISDPWKADLFARLDRIHAICGELCMMNTLDSLKQRYVKFEGASFPMVAVPNVNCPAILSSEDLDAGDITTPAIPHEIESYFTINGSSPLVARKKERRSEIHLGSDLIENVWEESDVEEAVKAVENGTLEGSYGVELVVALRDKLRQLDMKGKSVLVIGSARPWIESILLYLGVAKVTTLEYGSIVSKHPKIEALTPQEFRQRFQQGELEEFDGVVSHSSVEHSGLGRYGDALNPWGDILTVARAWCVTKEGGFLYLGVPTGKDAVYSNWHRIYGKIRWPLLAANWRLVDQTGSEMRRDRFRAGRLGGHGYIFRKESSKL